MGRNREGVEDKTKFYVRLRDVRIVCPRLKPAFAGTFGDAAVLRATLCDIS